MYLLDTDHLTVLERGGEESLRLRQRLQQVSPHEVAAQDATLLSRNVTDFQKVPGLRVEDWTV